MVITGFVRYIKSTFKKICLPLSNVIPRVLFSPRSTLVSYGGGGFCPGRNAVGTPLVPGIPGSGSPFK